MYSLAEKTASYKQRNLSQDESLKEITTAVRGQIVTFSAIEAAIESPDFEQRHEQLVGLRNSIRSYPGNTLMEQAEEDEPRSS